MQTKIKLPKVVIVIVFIMYFNMTQKEKKNKPQKPTHTVNDGWIIFSCSSFGVILFTLLAVTLLNLTGKPECDKGSSVVSNQTWQMIQGCCSSSHSLHAFITCWGAVHTPNTKSFNTEENFNTHKQQTHVILMPTYWLKIIQWPLPVCRLGTMAAMEGDKCSTFCIIWVLVVYCMQSICEGEHTSCTNLPTWGLNICMFSQKCIFLSK